MSDNLWAENKKKDKEIDILKSFEVPRKSVRITTLNPQHATPASRPAGDVGELVYYSGKLYFCTSSTVPTWEKVTST